MDIISSAPTIKQRRKFERIETSNMNNQDTSSINHVSDVDTRGKLSKCVHGEVQILADCCKESIKKFYLREKNGDQRRLSDLVSHSRLDSSREDHSNMNKTLLYLILSFPFFTSIVIFGIIYVICIYKSETKPHILYISEIALDSPESSFFALFLNMISITVATSIFLRHLVLRQYLRDYGQERIKESWVNIMFWTNILVFISLELIGTFPVINITNVVLHFIGVIVFFATSMFTCIVQTAFTYYTINVLCDRRVYYLRFALTMLVLTSGMVAFVSGLLSWFQFEGEDYRNWQPNDGGYTWHVISVITEWLFVFTSNLFIITLACELHSSIFHMPIIKVKYLTVKEKTES